MHLQDSKTTGRSQQHPTCQKCHACGVPVEKQGSLVCVDKVPDVDERLRVACQEVVNSHGAVGGQAEVSKDTNAVLAEAGGDCSKGCEGECRALVAASITDLQTCTCEIGALG